MPPINPQPLLLQVLINPENNIVMDQLPYLPGYEQVHAGQPLNPDQFRRFRTCLFKTIKLHRERHIARLQLTKLSHRASIEKWVHHFAPFSPQLIDALLPFIKLSCYSFAWPYAELWHLLDTPGARTIKLVKSFSFAYDRWIIVEPVLASLDAYMKSRSITLPSREIPGDAFTSHRVAWGIECINSCHDETRAQLMKEAFIERAYVLPIQGDFPGTVSHALVFYGKHPTGYIYSGPRRFVEHGARYIKECYGKVEVIKEDETDDADSTKDKNEKKGVLAAIMPPVMGSARRRIRLRRSKSCMHNLGRGM